VAAWALDTDHHAALPVEWSSFVINAGIGLFVAAIAWLLYVALEPIIRRSHPHLVVSWARLLAGRCKDPGVGRDVLLGRWAGGAVGGGHRDEVGGAAGADPGDHAPGLAGAAGGVAGALGVQHRAADGAPGRVVRAPDADRADADRDAGGVGLLHRDAARTTAP